MPSGGAATDDINVPVVMVSRDAGQRIEKALRWKDAAPRPSGDNCLSLCDGLQMATTPTMRTLPNPSKTGFVSSSSGRRRLGMIQAAAAAAPRPCPRTVRLTRIGRRLVSFRNFGPQAPVSAWLGPANRCERPVTFMPTRDDDVDDEERPPLEGVARFRCGAGGFEARFRVAAFGPPPDSTAPFGIVKAAPPHLCALAGVERRVAGFGAVALRGGGCGFTEKSRVAEQLGAAAPRPRLCFV